MTGKLDAGPWVEASSLQRPAAGGGLSSIHDHAEAHKNQELSLARRISYGTRLSEMGQATTYVRRGRL